MNARATALAAAVALTCAGATTATAAPRRPARPVCNLVVDPANDVSLRQDPAVDILSADLVSNATHVTAAIRISGKPGALQQDSPTGQTYRMSFQGGGRGFPVFLLYMTSAAGSGAVYGFSDPQHPGWQMKGVASAKVVGNVVYITAPLSALAEWTTLTPGTRITALAARTARAVGHWEDAMNHGYIDPVDADTAPGKVAYVAGTRSCVKVGG